MDVNFDVGGDNRLSNRTTYILLIIGFSLGIYMLLTGTPR